MRTLVKSLASSLILEDEAQPQDPAPAVYTTAICSAGNLVASLTGIAQLTRELGFTLHPETLYASDGGSATYHADHAEVPVALAVSGMDADETLECFNTLERALFGDC